MSATRCRSTAVVYATSDKCKRDVNSGRELESILTAAGDCASSCVFALIGGSRRELSERAQVRIHSYKFFSTKGGKHRMATPAKRAAPLMAKFDVEAERYIHDMGASRELFTAIRSVPYEQMRTLTRNEIVRFGIDTRKFPSVNLPMAGPIKLFDVQERAMTFFIAKGGPNSCGPGCDTWIAAHGLLDPTALIRFRNFLEMIGPSDLPMFIHSVEGSFTQAISIGGLARDRKMRIGVGLTVPLECKGAASSEECDRIRTGGGELKSVLRTDAVCGPACFYLLLGGARREVAADAVLQVRPVKVLLDVQGSDHRQRGRNGGGSDPGKRNRRFARSLCCENGVRQNLVTLAEGVEGRGTRTLRRDEIVRLWHRAAHQRRRAYALMAIMLSSSRKFL